MLLLKMFLLTYSLEAGLIPEQSICLYDEATYPFANVIKQRDAFYFEYENTIRYKTVWVSGGLTAFSLKSSKSSFFTPVRADFAFGAGVTVEFITVGFEHGCYHPVAPNMPRFPLPKIDYAYNRMFVRIESKIK